MFIIYATSLRIKFESRARDTLGLGMDFSLVAGSIIANQTAASSFILRDEFVGQRYSCLRAFTGKAKGFNQGN